MKFFVIDLIERPGMIRYPQYYQNQIGDFAVDHLYYHDEKGDLKLLLLIPDKDAANIARPGVREITEVEARKISDAYDMQTERVTDEAKVRRIELKVQRGQVLTTDEEKALDPNDSTPGFGKNQTLADRIARHKEIESYKK